MSEKECTICGGSGEIETEINCEQQTVGCPLCIEQAKDEQIASLELRIKELERPISLRCSNATGAAANLMTLAEANQEISQLEQRLAEAERDAKRYQWLHTMCGAGYPFHCFIIPGYGACKSPEEFDLAIDAAMEKSHVK